MGSWAGARKGHSFTGGYPDSPPSSPDSVEKFSLFIGLPKVCRCKVVTALGLTLKVVSIKGLRRLFASFLVQNP